MVGGKGNISSENMLNVRPNSSWKNSSQTLSAQEGITHVHLWMASYGFVIWNEGSLSDVEVTVWSNVGRVM